MDNSIYITLSRQAALFRDMDATAGNIANANTTGYTASHILFNTYLTKDVNLGEQNKMEFPHDISTYRDLTPGPIRATGNPLDVALQEAGFFVVQTPLGNRYTRSGNFQIAPDGTLTNADGYPVLDNSSQAILLPEDTTTVDIGEAGNIKVNGEDFAIIGVVQFENEQMLERLNGTLFNSEITPPFVENARMVQGSLESSNVQPIMEFTHMISVSRAVTNTAKFIEVVYDLQRKAANTWAQQA